MADLTYNTVAIANDVIPLNIGYIACYAIDKFGDSIKITLFKYIEELETAINESPPDILACSNYLWNHQINLELSRKLKKLNPNALVVWGGPDFPADIPSQEVFMNKFSEFDIYVRIEGETGFVNIVKRALEANSIENIREKVLTSPIDGCISRTADGKLQYSNPVIRIKNLDEIPSPYLTGILDKFFDGKLSPMLQTNRGCPFRCTFCTDGSMNVQQVNQFSTSRVADELEYIPKHITKNTHKLYISDLNFGMIPRDIEVCQKISEIQEKFGYPLTILSTTGKNNKERIIKSIKELKGALRLFISVQSLDKQVLENIKRDNISTDQLLALSPAIKESGLRTYSECIVGLPGETYQSHLDTIHDLIRSNVEGIIVYSCLLINGAEMNTPKEREKWKLKTKFRLLHKAFTELSDGQRTFEVEEVVIGSNTLTYEEYVELRVFAFIIWVTGVGIFYDSLIRFLQEKNIDIFDLFFNALQKRHSSQYDIEKVIKSFEFHTKDELFDSPEQLREFHQKDENYNKLLNFEAGINITQFHHAILISKYMDDWNEYIISLARELLEQKHVVDEYVEQQFQDVANYCRGLTHNILGHDRMKTNPIYEFKHDIQKWLSDNNSILSSYRLSKPEKISFIFSEEKFNLVEEDLDKFGKNTTGITRMFFDLPIEDFLRKPTKLSLN